MLNHEGKNHSARNAVHHLEEPLLLQSLQQYHRYRARYQGSHSLLPAKWDKKGGLPHDIRDFNQIKLLVRVGTPDQQYYVAWYMLRSHSKVDDPGEADYKEDDDNHYCWNKLDLTGV